MLGFEINWFPITLGLVTWVAKDFRWATSPTIDIVDLVQEGNVGLIKAIDAYQPEKGYQLSTLAVTYIKRAIRDFIAEQAHIVNVSMKGNSERTRVFYNLDRQRDLLSSQGRGFNPELVAENPEYG